jgi:hypothetical protein
MTRPSNAVKAATVAKVLALSLLLGGSGVGYVFQKDQIHGLMQQVKDNDQTIHELVTRQKQLKALLEESTTRARLELLGRHFQLGLQMPGPGRTVTLGEPEIHRDAPVQLVNQ